MGGISICCAALVEALFFTGPFDQKIIIAGVNGHYAIELHFILTARTVGVAARAERCQRV